VSLGLYGWDGEPISLEEYVWLVSQERHVGDTTVGPYRISTVWLGINYGFSPSGPPIIFETMVFDTRRKELVDEYLERYATLEQARRGHANTVGMVRALSPDDTPEE
jgi:hypothetical protein